MMVDLRQEADVATPLATPFSVPPGASAHRKTEKRGGHRKTSQKQRNAR